MKPITTTAELAAFCNELQGEPFVAVDTEFMRETTYWPKLCLIQVASPTHEAVIDPLADDIDLEPLLAVMRDERILKVFHAARQDVEIFNNLKAMPKPLFDTQVAGMAAGFGEQIAYDALVRQMLRIEIDKSSRFTDWARRPLTEAQLSYALADVTHLAKLFPILRERLETSGRLAWVEEEMTAISDPAAYDVDPEKAWRRLRPRKTQAKYLAVFKAVAAWRERTAQNRDQPRGRILKDEAIDEIASQTPTDPEAFQPPALGAQGVRRLTPRNRAVGRAEARAGRPGGPCAQAGAPGPQPACAAVGGRAAEGAAEGQERQCRRGHQADRQRRRPGKRSPCRTRPTSTP